MLKSAILMCCAASALALKSTLKTSTTTAIAGPTNVLLGGTATQSSTYSASSNAQAKNAIDGNPSCSWNNAASGLSVPNVLSSTNFESNPWLQVDMGSSKDIQQVTVRNRADCCQDRLTNYQVHIGNDPNVFANPACPGLFTGEQTIACAQSGRYVGVTIPGDNQMLTVCEILAYTTPANQIWPVKVSQSSLAYNPQGVPENAVDGGKGA
jgi:hypothetical protein